MTLLSVALPKGSVGPYQLQAAIAAVHDEAARAEETDWPQILALYDLLKRMSDNPIVSLNHAIAAAMVHGTSKGLELLLALDPDPRLARFIDAMLFAHICLNGRRPQVGNKPSPARRGARHELAGTELPHDANGSPQ